MSRTTNATPPAPNSPTRPSISYGKRFPGTGPICVIRSPTISASYRPRIFGLWRERGIDKVLQADFEARPHDPDGAHDAAARRGLLRAEHMLNARADATLYPVRRCFDLR